MKTKHEAMEFLASLMTEEIIEETAAQSEVDSLYNSIYSAIDDKYLSAIEPVCSATKYETINKIKLMLIEYRLMLYFPELIGKQIAGFYGYSDIAKIMTKHFGFTPDKSSLTRTLWLPDNLPCVFSCRESNDFRLLNQPENIIQLDQSDWINVKALCDNDFDVSSLIKLLSIPLSNSLPDLAYVTIPNSSSSYIIEASKKLTDIIIAQPSDALNFFLANEQKSYCNVKCLCVVGRCNNNTVLCLNKYAEQTGIGIFYTSGLSKLLELLRSIGVGKSQNYLLASRIEAAMNDSTATLAEKICFEKSQFNRINTEITLGEDAEVCNFISGIRDQLSATIRNDTANYYKLISVCDRICLDAEKLDGLMKERYYDNDEVTENGAKTPTVGLAHFDELTVLKMLLQQHLAFSAIDKTRQNRTKSIMKSIGTFGEKYALAAELLYEIKVENKKPKKKAMAFLEMDEKSDQFLLKSQLYIGDYFRHSSITLAYVASMITDISLNYEHYYRGIGFEKNGEQNKALNEYRTALSMGYVAAGERYIRIVDIKKMKTLFLKDFADALVPTACYAYANRNVGKDRIWQKYMKIAAVYEYKPAIFALADYYYKCVEDDLDVNDSLELATSCYENIIKLERSPKSEVFLRLGKLYYYQENYEAAKINLEKSNTGYGYYIIGKMLENGDGFAKDYQKAIEYYTKSHDMGYTDAAAALTSLASRIANEKQKNVASETTSYSSYSYYSYYSYSDSGCVTSGTKIMSADGRLINIEDIVPNTAIMNCKGTESYTSEELVINSSVNALYSINNDIPFMSLEHAIMTQRGWCSLNPELSMKINSNFSVELLQEGDVIRMAYIENGEIAYRDCIVEKINVMENTSRKTCYDLHFYDGYNSYYANGYPCLLNYPTLTLASLKRNLSELSPDEQIRFAEMVQKYKDTMTQTFGKTSVDMFFEHEITSESQTE